MQRAAWCPGRVSIAKQRSCSSLLGPCPWRAHRTVFLSGGLRCYLGRRPQFFRLHLESQVGLLTFLTAVWSSCLVWESQHACLGLTHVGLLDKYEVPRWPKRRTWLYFLTPGFSVSVLLTRLHPPLLPGMACGRVNWGMLSRS